MPTTPKSREQEANLLALLIQPGPHRLAMLQRAGLVPPPGEISQAELAKQLGLPRSEIQRIERRALLKLRAQLTQ
jgi:DNA-directed RNA polymerase specialized sigma24 family protein